MNIDKYNTRVRQSISEEYVKCSKAKQDLFNAYTVARVRLESEKDTLPYNEYKRLEEEKEFLFKMMKIEEIKLDTWDKAREICLNVADEC